jgi:hypothetical protein
MDIAYIENMSIAMDMQILLKTFWSVVNRRNVFGRNPSVAKARGKYRQIAAVYPASLS